MDLTLNIKKMSRERFFSASGEIPRVLVTILFIIASVHIGFFLLLLWKRLRKHKEDYDEEKPIHNDHGGVFLPKHNIEKDLLVAIDQIYSVLLTNLEYEQVFKDVLSILGKVTGVDQVKMFKWSGKERGKPQVIKCLEWKNGHSGHEFNLIEENSFYKGNGWYSSLAVGKLLLGTIEKSKLQFEEYKPDRMSPILLVPIIVENRFSAFISFMVNKNQYWAPSIVKMLLTVTSMLERVVEGKQEEERLSEIVERYRIICENISALIYEIGENGNILYISPSVTRITGFCAQELIEKCFFDLVYFEDRPKLVTTLLKTKNNKQSSEVIFRIKHKNGEWCWLEGSTKLYRTIEEELHWVFVTRDITDQRRLENEIIELNKNELLTIVSKKIANEINNILGILVEEITDLKRDFPGESLVYAKLIKTEKALERAEELTEQLRTLTKKKGPTKEVVFVDQIVNDALNLLLCGTKISFSLKKEKELWPIEANKAQIEQVFSTIIVNAVQAMPEGGEIKVNITNKKEENGWFLPTGKYIKIRIADTGMGINRDYLRKIFDPRFTTKEEGTGLGLAISSSIIKKYGGEIKATSKQGKGTLFVIYLPAI